MKNGDIVRLKYGSGSWAAGTPVTVVSVGKTGRVSVTMPNLDTYAYDADDLEPVRLARQADRVARVAVGRA